MYFSKSSWVLAESLNNETIKVKDNKILDCKFKTFGCGAAIATSSMITEIVKGKTVEEALEISNKTVAEALDGLPPIKMHCSNLAADGLSKAIEDYKKKSQGTKLTPETKDKNRKRKGTK